MSVLLQLNTYYTSVLHLSVFNYHKATLTNQLEFQENNLLEIPRI